LKGLGGSTKAQKCPRIAKGGKRDTTYKKVKGSLGKSSTPAKKRNRDVGEESRRKQESRNDKERSQDIQIKVKIIHGVLYGRVNLTS